MRPSEITEAMRLAFYEKAEVQKTGAIRYLDEALAAAITAAQADYESKIRSALVTSDRTPLPSVVGQWEVTQAQLHSACLSFRHDFGLLDESTKASVMFAAREWLSAWGKALRSDRTEDGRDDLIRELVRALKPFSKLFPDTTFINGVCCKDYDDDKGFFVIEDIPAPPDFHMRDVRSVRTALTLASEAGFNDGGEK